MTCYVQVSFSEILTRFTPKVAKLQRGLCFTTDGMSLDARWIFDRRGC